IDSIASVPGVDLVIEGAVDLSQSLGVPGNPLHASVQAAVSHVADRCAAAGVPFCAVPRADGQLEDWLRRGVTTFLT
ncbi:aldolase/citrate lyase family protein, partial [Acinetobacter baumannii]